MAVTFDHSIAAFPYAIVADLKGFNAIIEVLHGRVFPPTLMIFSAKCAESLAYFSGRHV